MTPYNHAKETYAALGVDTEAALSALTTIPISLQCWQGDDVCGFEPERMALSGGIQATGNYPGRARNIDELREDLDVALALIPGKHRVNLHAIYGDFGGARVERNEITTAHFQSWIDWAKERGMGLDFNPTLFAHRLSGSGTLSHPDAAVREFWIEHAIRCRRIGAEMGRQLGTDCVTNVWIPDGSKDMPFDRKSPRERLEVSLDAVFAEPLEGNIDAVESKLFGIGSESFVVGSHEFYLGYATRRGKWLCLDAGHFHPTESVADKISAVLGFVPGILLHVSRGVRWDSDHVVLMDDPTRAMLEEVVRGDFLPRTCIGMDFFDASINRVAAWTIGARNVIKCLLAALLEPASRLRSAEEAGDFTARLALLEETRSLPFAAVWAEHCARSGVPAGFEWMDAVKAHEAKTLAARS